MNIKNIMTIANGLTRTVRIFLHKNSAKIYIGGGIIAMGTGTILAAKASVRLPEVLKETKDNLDDVRENGYDEEHEKKELAKVYVKAGTQIAYMYTPAAIATTTGIVSILIGAKIFNDRNAALASAYTTMLGSYNEYRKRVREKYGDEEDHKLYYGVVDETHEVTTTNSKGKKITKKENVAVYPNHVGSPYARFFDEVNSRAWTNDSAYNQSFILAQERIANYNLRRNGFLYLNDVYELLGFHKTKEGQVVGWVYDKDNQVGDKFVDFGIHDVTRKGVVDFLNGYEKSVLLDFNVAGEIWSLLENSDYAKNW